MLCGFDVLPESAARRDFVHGAQLDMCSISDCSWPLRVTDTWTHLHFSFEQQLCVELGQSVVSQTGKAVDDSCGSCVLFITHLLHTHTHTPLRHNLPTRWFVVICVLKKHSSWTHFHAQLYNVRYQFTSIPCITVLNRTRNLQRNLHTKGFLVKNWAQLKHPQTGSTIHSQRG